MLSEITKNEVLVYAEAEAKMRMFALNLDFITPINLEIIIAKTAKHFRCKPDYDLDNIADAIEESFRLDNYTT